jgi:hypothetical protein
LAAGHTCFSLNDGWGTLFLFRESTASMKYRLFKDKLIHDQCKAQIQRIESTAHVLGRPADVYFLNEEGFEVCIEDGVVRPDTDMIVWIEKCWKGLLPDFTLNMRHKDTAKILWSFTSAEADGVSVIEIVSYSESQVVLVYSLYTGGLYGVVVELTGKIYTMKLGVNDPEYLIQNNVIYVEVPYVQIQRYDLFSLQPLAPLMSDEAVEIGLLEEIDLP